jgi:hypothetical protein
VTVDGESQIVEYVFTKAEGKELSGVNVPAVPGTRIEDVRAALSAELHLHPTRPNRPKEPSMPFPKLAAALALTALTEADDDRAAQVISGLRERALNAEIELGTLRADVTRLTAEVTAARTASAAALTAQTDREIADAYAAGKLGYGKDAEGKNTPDPLESLLREHGTTAGFDSLKGKLALMVVRVPVGQRPVVQLATEPKKTALGSVPLASENPHLGNVAAQLGVKPEDVAKRANALGNGAA